MALLGFGGAPAHATVSAAALDGPRYDITLPDRFVYQAGTFGSGGYTVSAGASPSSFVRATASGSSDYSVYGNMVYGFSIGGSDTEMVVPVSLDYFMSLHSVRGKSSDTGGQTHVAIEGYNGSSSDDIRSGDATFSEDRHGTLHQEVITGRGYSIILSANAGTRGPGSSSADALVDPYLYIDPVFLAAHPGLTVSVSPGVVNAPMVDPTSNAPASSVPEPASAALALIGLMGCGVVRRRQMA